MAWQSRSEALEARTRKEEGIVGVAGRVLLRLEEGVEIPEAALNEVVCWHLLETHLSENLLKLSPDLRAQGGGESVAKLRLYQAPNITSEGSTREGKALACIPCLEQRVEVTTRRRDAHSVEVVFLEGFLLPLVPREMHVARPRPVSRRPSET